MHAPLEPGAPSRMAIGGAALTIAGVMLSGPIGFLLVSFVHPPGAWDGAGSSPMYSGAVASSARLPP